MINFKQFCNEAGRSQYFAELNICDNDMLMDAVKKARNVKETKEFLLKLKNEFKDLKQINFDEINWEQLRDYVLGDY